jgi:hypothetical protein
VAADPTNGFVRNELAALDLYLGRALLASNRASDRHEACRAIADAKATWTLMQAHCTPAESADGLDLVEQSRARCP